MPIAPSQIPSISTTVPGSYSGPPSTHGTGRTVNAGRSGDGGDGSQRINLGGSSLDSSFSIGHDQTVLRRGDNSYAGVLEEGLTLSPAVAAGGFNTGAYSGIAESPALFNFDWEATFDPLSVAGNLYDTPTEIPIEVKSQSTPKKEFTVSASASSRPTSSTATPTLSSANPAIVSASSTSQASPLVRTGIKRKADSEPSSAVLNWAVPANREDSRKRGHTGPGTNSLLTSQKSGLGPGVVPTGTSGSGIADTRGDNGVVNSRSNSTGLEPTTATSHHAPPSTARRTASEGADATMGRVPSMLHAARKQSYPDIPKILPHEKVFPVQIGSELFRLSGASISSDAPSYFSQFFERQLQNEDGAGGVRTLYIDRDPVTFKDISLHLQGYHVQPRDGEHFVRLFADAQFYSLPRLISQLFDSQIFITIGGRNFQIPRDIFSSPGDSPNFFSLGFAVFFSTPAEVFPGLNREGLLRPPSILPASVPNRSADVFAELLHMLRGYPLRIRDDEHRAELLRDCRYFHLRGLEQKLIPHHISYNYKRNISEIVIRLEDIRQSGVSFVGDSSPQDRSPSSGWVNYSRPFVDDVARELILEVSGESTKIDFRSMRAEFVGQARARISSLFQVIANKMNLPVNQPLGLMMLSSGGAANHPVSPGNTPLSQDKVKIRLERNAQIVLDGEDYWGDRSEFGSTESRYDDMENNNSSTNLMTPTPTTISSLNPPPSGGSGPGQGRTNPSASNSNSHTNSSPAAPWGIGGGQTAPPLSRPPSTPLRKRKRRGSMDEFGEWIIKRGQWRLRVQSTGDGRGGMEVVMCAVKLDAFGGEGGRNRERSFLTE